MYYIFLQKRMKFLEYFLTIFPDSSVTPKMHILEEHVVLFIQKWRVGLSMMGEQGAESIYARFNALERTYSLLPVEPSGGSACLNHPELACSTLNSWEIVCSLLSWVVRAYSGGWNHPELMRDRPAILAPCWIVWIKQVRLSHEFEVVQTCRTYSIHSVQQGVRTARWPLMISE